MAAVYRAFDERRGHPVALKRLASRRSPAGGTRDRNGQLFFRREFQTLSELSHPLIIDVYDYGVDDEGAYYTMELLEGDDLRAMAPLEWRRACELLRDVASALAIVHSRRFVHRDVTPQNVRSPVEGRAKLFDFGTLTPMGPAREVAGTPPFVPPEAFSGQPLDERTDLFALGALGYYLLTGRHAYPARRFSEIARTWQQPLMPITRFA